MVTPRPQIAQAVNYAAIGVHKRLHQAGVDIVTARPVDFSAGTLGAGECLWRAGTGAERRRSLVHAVPRRATRPETALREATRSSVASCGIAGPLEPDGRDPWRACWRAGCDRNLGTDALLHAVQAHLDGAIATHQAGRPADALRRIGRSSVPRSATRKWRTSTPPHSTRLDNWGPPSRRSGCRRPAPKIPRVASASGHPREAGMGTGLAGAPPARGAQTHRYRTSRSCGGRACARSAGRGAVHADAARTVAAQPCRRPAA